MNINAYKHQSFNKNVLFFALALMLWASFAYVEHQVDYDQAHHQQHQCELYTLADNGLTPHQFIIPQTPQSRAEVLLFSDNIVATSLPTQKARAPPKTSQLT